MLRKIILGWLVVLACRSAGAETLDYRLAYRGLLTLFLWKELADVQLTAEADAQGRCELAMRLTTQDHPLAEAVRPTRYMWWSRNRPGLERVEAVVIRDLGPKALEARLALVGGEHLDYYKRDFKPPPPKAEHFQPLNGDRPHPALESGARKSLPNGRLLDPLGFVVRARWFDYERGPLVAVVLYKNEVRNYKARLVGRDVIEPAGRKVPALVVRFSRDHRQAARREGFMRVWFSDDRRRLPLKFVIRGKVGALQVVLRPQGLTSGAVPEVCRPSEGK